VTEPLTYTQVRLVNLSGDKTKVEQGARSVSPTEKTYVMGKWTEIMERYPHLHLAIEERSVTQTFTEWETIKEKPKDTLF
jgi:hypothetical protein